MEWNHSQEISDLEGVTHTDFDYWECIRELDLSNSQLSPQARENLTNVLFKQREAASVRGKVGKLKNFYYRIKMSSDQVYNKESYHVNYITQTIMGNKIKELMGQEIAIKYMSEYSSSVLLVKKPSGKGELNPWKAKYRVVIYLREKNQVIIHLQYSLPVIHEIQTAINM